jgi:hypothetical protein
MPRTVSSIAKEDTFRLPRFFSFADLGAISDLNTVATFSSSLPG